MTEGSQIMVGAGQEGGREVRQEHDGKRDTGGASQAKGRRGQEDGKEVGQAHDMRVVGRSHKSMLGVC